MYKLLIKQFLRSRMTVSTLAVLFLMGITSILLGKQFLSKHHETAEKVAHHQHDHIQHNVAAHDEMGLLLYYLRFALISHPDKLAGLSIGQRDINPGIQRVTIRTLEAQKYDPDLTNPVHLQSGNFDLGFVIIYLFPLAIIAFTFNLLSEEREHGVWKIVRVQSKTPFRFLLAKLSVRMLFLFLLLLFLFGAAFLMLGLSLGEAFLAFVVISLLYTAFWAAICFWLAMFGKSSGFNALTLLSIWVALTILVPSCVNNMISAAYPIPESLATMVKQRDGYHEKWDIDKKITMDKFYERYPQFSELGVPEETFSWLWYYAMQQMGDEESSGESRAMRTKLLQRERVSRLVAFGIPTIHTQLHLNDFARTSLSDYIRLLDSVSVFHERTRLYFYHKIFANASVKEEDWSRFKPEFLPERSAIDWPKAVAPLLILSSLFGMWSLVLKPRLASA